MATYVLVHGAWHGGWCWQKVVPLLRAAGHTVSTPTLTGLGERAHLLSPGITLDTHLQDVVNVLAYEDLTEVILVGHSYGGVVITGVAHRIPERLAHLVYLDAFIPADGEAVFDLLRPESGARLLDQARSSGDGWQLPPQPLAAFGVSEAADLHWAGAKVGPHPLTTWQQPVAANNPLAATLARTYIWCADFPGFTRFAERTRTDPTWRYHELATGHDAMITQPGELAQVLLEATTPP